MTNNDKLMSAIEEMGMQFSDCWGALGHLTCAEFRPIAEVLILAGRPQLAADALLSHGKGDIDEEDEHHELYQGSSDLAMSHVRLIAEDLGVAL